MENLLLNNLALFNHKKNSQNAIIFEKGFGKKYLSCKKFYKFSIKIYY